MKHKMKSFGLLFFWGMISCTSNAGEVHGDLRTVLDAQINNSVIDIPKGTYILDLKDGKQPYLFSYKKNVQVKGNGSTIICNYQKQAFSFEHCEDMVFSDLTIEYDPPCSTQGTITQMSADAKTLQVEIHEGYPMLNPETVQNRVHFFDKDTRELIWNLYTNEIKDPIVYLEGRKVQVNLTMPKVGTYEVGDFVVFNNIPTTYVGHCIIMNYCKNMTMSGITIYDSPAFHFAEHYCENTHYYRCIIDRKVDDPKYPQDRLRPGIADGIHSRHATIGPTIEECVIQYTNDDPIAINGNFYPVYKVDKEYKQLYVLARDYNLADVTIKKDENVVVVSNDGVCRGEARPIRVTLSADPTAEDIKKCLSYFKDIKDTRYIRTVMVRFSAEDWDKVSNVTPGDVIYSTDRIGAGFRVINNKIGHVPGRGILIKSSDGKIQNNEITYTGAGAIIIAPEFNWMEAGLSRNLEISGNHIETCMFRQNLKRSQAAAISVVLEASNGDLAPAGGFKNIIIHRNTIKNCPKPCVFLNAIDGGYFYKNTIEPATWIRDHGQNFLIRNDMEYVTKYVKNIVTDKDPVGTGLSQIKHDREKLVRVDNNGYVSLNGYQEKQVKMRVFDAYGQLILEDSFSGYSSVTLHRLKQGIYIINLICNDESFSKKYSVF